ncbi:metalloregulator ArsR/SmtB family transcription factor [Minwuia thermotolerans]|uniref:HTH arsR-type domain-containing protein n=1 Tax=Minwuia thermotolerans TaxID=2056226 RepID=A0A2M9FXD3_9PROT|nr:hypothetical protein CVT23_18955 [Minwuia thermotolerans]
METSIATGAFQALGHYQRLRIFRRLVREAPDGLTAGELSAVLSVAPSGLSFHLAQLEGAGLVSSVRSGRRIHYAVNPSAVRALIGFLAEDCCGGRPELCSVGGLSAPLEEGEGNMTENKLNVLFLCTGNSARSIIAEAILSREGAGRFNAWSAGSQPKGEVHPYALELLRNLNHDVTRFRSKSWEEFAGPEAPRLDFVFTVCDNAAAETCPIWPGQPMSAHWGIPDPAAVEGTEAVKRQAFADAYRMMNNRISIFVNLPLKSLGRIALKERLDEIGRPASVTT